MKSELYIDRAVTSLRNAASFAVTPLACGLWFHLGFEHFDIISMADKSRYTHRKLFSICQLLIQDFH